MGPILILTQGFAGDRLGAHLIPGLRARFPDIELIGLGGPRMEEQGVRLVARTDRISAMGVSGLLPQVPRILGTMRQAAAATRDPLPACVIAVDVWQPLRFLHRFGPHLQALPHLCYLPPGPNFIGQSRVHRAAAERFASVITPFPHQARLYGEAGARVRLAAHAGLQACLRETRPLPWDQRENLLAILPGSRAAEISSSLPVQYAAARRVQERHPELKPVVCCASAEVARLVERRYPGLEHRPNAREVLARARFGIICSGTASLEAAVLGCPGVVTYNGTALQRWEWHTFHVSKLTELRARGIASPYVALPNILAGRELYPEIIDAPADRIAEAALAELAGDPAARHAALDEITRTLPWDDAGQVIAEELAGAITP